jgi:serine protease
MDLLLGRASRTLPWAGGAPAALLLLLAGCGGGGGGGGGPDPVSTGTIAGTIVLPDANGGILADREPNDTAAQAQRLPPLQPRSTVLVAGEAGASGARQGFPDLVDAFRTVSHVPATVTLTLTQSSGGLVTADLDLAALDTASASPLAASATPSNPEVVSFTVGADEPFDVLVTCAAGDGAYVLRIVTTDPPPAAVVATSLPRAARVAIAAIESDGHPALETTPYLLEEPDCAPARVLVRATSRDPAEGARIAATLAGRALRTTGAGTHVIEVPRGAHHAAGREALAAAAVAASAPGVAWAEPDWVVRPLATPNDPGFGRQWNLIGIGCPSAWDVTTGSPTVVVGMVDTGIASHLDLDANRVPGFDFVSDPGIAGDGNGRDSDGTDPGDLDDTDHTSTWHGTHTAGIVAARQNDGFGLSGVAPGCRVMPLRALGRTGGTMSDLADAIRYASGHVVPGPAAPLPAPLRIVNCSLGSPQGSQELEDACDAARDAGTLLVASTGNDGGPVLFPAAYPSVLAVGAVDSRLVQASYSNVGPQVACVAPGGNDNRDRDGDGFLDGVSSDVVDETVVPFASGEAAYVGTSMAAPHVAGVAALVLSVDPSLTRAQLIDTVLSSCRDVGTPGVDDATGHGLVQAGAAVKLALANLGTPRTDAPRLLLTTTTLRFPAASTVLDVPVLNAGGGVLHVASATASTDSGVPWLTGLRIPQAGGDSDTSEIAVVVNRVGLATGLHAGTVLISDGTTVVGAIRVLLEVGASPLVGHRFVVAALENATGIVRSSGFADPLDAHRYALAGLPPGAYTISAGTDLDGDGIFGEGPDWEGEHAVPVTVAAGQRVAGIDVVLVP